MEIWGLCGDCERWFYCDAWFDKEAPQPVCPHCGGEPAAIENRGYVDGTDNYVRVTTADRDVLELALPTEVWLG